jgi:hypothetical protein
MVAEAQHRSASSRAQALAAHTGGWPTRADDTAARASTGRSEVTLACGNTAGRRQASPDDRVLKQTTLCEELFHTPNGVAFADFITDDHRETWPIRSAETGFGAVITVNRRPIGTPIGIQKGPPGPTL